MLQDLLKLVRFRRRRQLRSPQLVDARMMRDRQVIIRTCFVQDPQWVDAVEKLPRVAPTVYC